MNKCAAVLWNQLFFHIWTFTDGETEDLLKNHSLQYTWVLPELAITSRQGGITFVEFQPVRLMKSPGLIVDMDTGLSVLFGSLLFTFASINSKESPKTHIIRTPRK